jgi:hypothetical protein
VILKGNLHAHGMKLVSYMLSAEKGEAAEFVAQRGFDYFHHDPEVAADIMQGMAAENSKSPKPFFHGHLRTDPRERLTDAQWMEAIDRMERRAGFTGQPRLVTQHVNHETGERHFHVAWFRFDPEQGGVINPGLYKNHFKEEARRIERDFALRELSNDRRPDDRARAGMRNELEESRRLGTDLKSIRTAILDCFEKSDNGKSLAAAIRAQGMELANGDRRDCFVVIDAAGGQHALNKKLTGMTLAAIRERLADLDRAQLPGVDQAKEMQAARAAVVAQERVKHGRGADGAGQGIAPSGERESGAQPAIKPLGKTAGEIRLAWQLTKTPGQFAQALEDRGLILVHVSREEAEKSWRAAAFHKAIGRQSRALKEGFAVVDQRGNFYRVDQRTTGDHWEEIQKRLGGIDRRELLTVDQAREAMAEARKTEFAETKRAEREAAWVDRQKARPATELEQTIIAADKKAGRDDALFAAELGQAGIALVRVTASDVKALDALRQEQDIRLTVATAEPDSPAQRLRTFARVREGELCVVTKWGDVIALNQQHIAALENRTFPTPAGDGSRSTEIVPDGKTALALPSVTEQRAAFELDAELLAEFFKAINEGRAIDRQAALDRRIDRFETAQAIERQDGIVDAVQEAKQGVIGAAEQAVDTGTRAATRGLDGLASMAEAAISYAADFLVPPPPPTKEQVRHMQEDAEFRRDLAAWAAEEAAKAEQQEQARRDQQAAEREAEEEARRREWRDRDRERDRS